MKILHAALILLTVCTIGCQLRQGHSVCDSIEPGESVLCDIASAQGVSLEVVGNGLIVVNAIAIGERLYSSREAIEVLEALYGTLEWPITYMLFRDEINKALANYPGLINIIEIYLTEFSLSKRISITDKEILQRWIQARISSLKTIN